MVDTPDSVGTAFAVDHDRLVTAAHVVGDSDQVRVSVGQRSWRADVIETLRARDIALLKIPGSQLNPLPWWRGDAAPVGQQAFAAGAALGQLSVTRGIVSGTRQFGGMTYLQTDAAVNPGNSGGPLLAENGRVLGLVVSKLRRAEGISLAVPAAEVRAFVRTTRSDTTDPDPTGDQAGSGPEDARSRSPATSAWWLAVPGAALLALFVARATTLGRRKPAPPIVITDEDLSRGTPVPVAGPDRHIVVTPDTEQEQDS